MDYRSALEFFRDRSDYDRGFISNPFAGNEAARAGLRRTRLLLDTLGSPDRAYPIIHVAGTKGKGSTCAFIEAVAREMGYTTGLFTTPHLHSIRERIQVNRESVTERAWANATAETANALRAVETSNPDLGRITAFEINTAMALLHFANESVDLGVVEVGLGGRLDATNVVTPNVSVITPVSYDHQAILGDNLAEIASEKAGIIKSGVPVVVAQQAPDAVKMILDIAAKQNAPVHAAGSHWYARYENSRATLTGPWGQLSNVRLGLAGAHQSMNAGAAMMALWSFDSEIFRDSDRVKAALSCTTWPGRFEVVQDSPPVIVDGAHNGASIEVLTAALLEDYPSSRFIVVFGSYVDKDLQAMLAALSPLEPTIVATTSVSPRARKPSSIAEASRNAGFKTVESNNVAQAVGTALDEADETAIIVATGSLSIVAEAREFFGRSEGSTVEREVLGS